MATYTFVGGTAGNIWGATANWSPSGIPGTNDDVIFNVSSPGCTVTTTNNILSANFTGYGNTLTFAATSFSYVTIGTGGLTLSSGMTISSLGTVAAVGANGFWIRNLANGGTSSITTNGCVIPRIRFGSASLNITNNININGTCTISDYYVHVYTACPYTINTWGGTVSFIGGSGVFQGNIGGNSTYLLNPGTGSQFTYSGNNFNVAKTLLIAAGGSVNFSGTLLINGGTIRHTSGNVGFIGTHTLDFQSSGRCDTGGITWDTVNVGFPNSFNGTATSNLNVGGTFTCGYNASSISFTTGGIVLNGSRFGGNTGSYRILTANTGTPFRAPITITGTGTRLITTIYDAALSNSTLQINMSGGTCIFAVPINLVGTQTLTEASTGTSFPSPSRLLMNNGTLLDSSNITWSSIQAPVSGTATIVNGRSVGFTMTQGSLNINGGLIVSGTMTLASAGSIVFAGTGGWTCGSLICTTAGRNITLAAGVTYTTTTYANMVGLTGSRVTMTSSSATARAAWTLGPAASQSIIYTNGTRIDSSAAQTVWSYAGTLTGTINWLNRGFVPTSGYPFVS
jgi:hypothetical protein